MAVKRVVKKKRPKRFLGTIVLLVIAVGISLFFYQKKLESQKKLDAINAEKKRMEMIISVEEKRKEEIENHKAYVQTKSYIEQVAREVLGLVYKNEVIFKAE